MDDSDPLYHASKVNVQDKFACYSQGVIADRSLEHLGRADAGVTLLRRMYFTEMDKVQAGFDPIGVVRSMRLGEIVRFDNVF